MAAGVAEFIKTLPESEREATQKHFDEYGEKRWQEKLISFKN